MTVGADGQPSSAASGSSGDFDGFFRSAWSPLMRLAFARLGDAGAAEDLVQDVLADAHRRWAGLSGYDDPLAWARRAVLNRTVSRWRRAGTERRALAVVGPEQERRSSGVDDPTADGLGGDEADPELWAAVRALPDRQRDVVLLLWFEDLPAAAVGEILGCGEDTVRTHWRRARVRLATTLGVADTDARTEEGR